VKRIGGVKYKTLLTGIKKLTNLNNRSTTTRSPGPWIGYFFRITPWLDSFNRKVALRFQFEDFLVENKSSFNKEAPFNI